MSKPLEALFHLQSLDTLLLEKQRVVTRYETELAARRAAIAGANAKIEGLMAQRKDAVSARALAERKVEDLTESLKQKRQRAQKARNEKEMYAGQGEVASAQEEIREAESAQLDAMAKVEEYEAAIELAKKERVELENEDHRQVSEAEERIAALRGEVAADKVARDAAAVGIDANLLKKYDFLLGRRAGLAVVEIDSTGCCGGCHVQIPPQTLLEVRRSAAIRVCQMCQRLLYAVAPPPAAEE